MVSVRSIFSGQFRRKVAMLGVALALSSGMALAKPPEPPLRSEVAMRILPADASLGAKIDPAAFRDHPLYRMVGIPVKELLGLDIGQLLNATFEGTFVAAVVAPAGNKRSSIIDFFEFLDRKESWNSNRDEVKSLATDLEDYFETNGEYPADLQTYFDEVRYYEPYLSGGAAYRYERLNDGKDYRLSMTFEKGSDLAKLGKPPVFSSRDGRLHQEPTLAAPPLNLVLGAKLTDRDTMRKVLDGMVGPSQNGFWKVNDADLPLTFTIRGDWFVASDRVENLGEFLNTLNGQRPGLSANSRFKVVERNIKTDGPFMLFVDTPHLIQASGVPASLSESKLANLVGPLGYSMILKPESQSELQLFMGVNAPKGSKLASYFSGGARPTPGSAFVTSNLPWDASNVFCVDYSSSKELLDAIVALFPEFEADYGMGQDLMMGMLGFDAQAGLNQLFSGPAIMSFERIDFLANTVESFFQEIDDASSLETEEATEAVVVEQQDGSAVEVVVVEESIAAESSVEEPVSAGAEESPPVDGEVVGEESESSPPEPPLAALGELPLTMAFRMPLQTNRDAFNGLIQSALGQEPTSKELFGVQVTTSQDGRISYAVDGEWVYLSGGRTDRLMRHMLEAAHGQKETLASIPSWSKFTGASRGRMLAYGHQKIDAFYSIAKGFLLFLGSEFRPLATELGQLRDYHSVATAVPDGFLMVGEMVQGDGR